MRRLPFPWNLHPSMRGHRCFSLDIFESTLMTRTSSSVPLIGVLIVLGIVAFEEVEHGIARYGAAEPPIGRAVGATR